MPFLFLFQKYLQPLKSPENAGLVDAALVDEIFYQVRSNGLEFIVSFIFICQFRF